MTRTKSPNGGQWGLSEVKDALTVLHVITSCFLHEGDISEPQ